jgi:hypothetical protein
MAEQAVIAGAQANLGPANVTMPTLEAVIRLTGINVLPFNDAKTTAFVEAVAAGVTGMARANVSIVQVFHRLALLQNQWQDAIRQRSEPPRYITSKFRLPPARSHICIFHKLPPPTLV